MFTPSHTPYTPAKVPTNSVPLVTSNSATFDTERNASLIMGPDRAGQQWHVTRMVTTAGAAGDFVRLFVYRNFASDTNLLDSTYQGASATSETDVSLLIGERLVFVWSNGTPGSPATIVINGEIL